jgi:two-component system chemotaxis sensor kinase CheA
VNDLREQLLVAFRTEHREYVAGLRALLDRLEQDGALTAAELEEAYRLAHSLAGAARVCDLPAIESAGHRLETFFGRLRKGELSPTRDRLAAMRAALDAIETVGQDLSPGASPPELVRAVARMDDVLEGDKTPRAPPAARARVEEGEGELNSKLLAAFQIEHREHLEGIRAYLAGVEHGDNVGGAGLDEAYRLAHSLKGAARLADLHAAETLAHRLETLFAQVRDGNLPLELDVRRAIHLGLDTIEDWAAALFEKRSPPDSATALVAIERAIAGGATSSAPAPSYRPLRSGTKERPDMRGSPVAVLPEKDAAPPPEPASSETAAETTVAAMAAVRVSADHLDRLLRSAGQLLTETLRQDQVTREVEELGRQIDRLAREWEAIRKSAAPALRRLAATPELAPVDRHVQRVAEEVRALARRVRQARQLQRRGAWALQRLGGQLQQDVRRVRTVPAESVFQGFRKMVRDLARDEGKEVELHVTGFDLQADRLVLQALKDPLMHILCNAISHGLEPPEERRDQGKDPVGRVTLHLETTGNRLHILIEDDGRGLDRRQVAEVAVRRGFLSEAEAEAAAPEELDRLVFRPGFTTARLVTGVSGRGMGLSVVAEAVARLQGEVELRPRDGPGTSFFLSVPLSVATQRLLLVACRGQTFAVPVHGVRRLLRVKLHDVETVEGRPMLLLGGQPVPLLSLAYLLGLDAADVSAADNVLSVMILFAGGRRVAAVVDDFLAERDTIVQELDDPARQVPTLAGGILLEDGTVALVLNPAALVRVLRLTDKPPLLKAAAPAPKKAAPTVLVVDDSLTTRTLEKSILEAHGYHVRLAVDGVEALAQLRTEPADLVLTDIQMPRLDGFGLLEEIKKDPRLAQLPVVVVTSMERREDQERGLALGADAYIVKRKFDHQELLDTIRQIL